MSQNLANLNITAADTSALRSALQSIRSTVGDRLVSLTPDQRRTLVKMGDHTRVFCQQAVSGLQANAASLPPAFDAAELSQDMADYVALEAFVAEYLALGEALDDTLKALASDVMTNSLAGVGVLKALNKLNPNLDTLLGSLKHVRRRKPKAATAPAA